MRLIGVAILCFASAAMVFGQRPGGGQTYGSLGGFGNVLYPGTGHAPSASQTFPARLGATVAGHPYGPGYYSYPVNAPRAAHPAGHGRSAVVPYPVYIGGGYYGGYAPDAYAAQPPQEQMPMMDSYGTPAVVINQNFVPDRARPVVREYGDEQPPPESSGMRLYQTPPTHPYADQGQQAQVRRQPAPDVQPTIYLLAFKDHNIIPALGYWMEGNTLHYVSVEHSLNQASLDLIDRDLSQRLNDERGVEFKLPRQN